MTLIFVVLAKILTLWRRKKQSLSVTDSNEQTCVTRHSHDCSLREQIFTFHVHRCFKWSQYLLLSLFLSLFFYQDGMRSKRHEHATHKLESCLLSQLTQTQITHPQMGLNFMNSLFLFFSVRVLHVCTNNESSSEKPKVNRMWAEALIECDDWKRSIDVSKVHFTISIASLERRWKVFLLTQQCLNNQHREKKSPSTLHFFFSLQTDTSDDNKSRVSKKTLCSILFLTTATTITVTRTTQNFTRKLKCIHLSCVHSWKW